MDITSTVDLLAPGPVRFVRFDLTTNCNLRCVYCAVSRPDYRGLDMPDDTIDAARTAILALSRHHRIEAVDMNGHGETTYRPGWDELCRELLAKQIPLRITSNFAKAFSQAELDVMAQMQEIIVSIDTDNRTLLQQIRRRVDVRQIVANMHAIRVRAARLRLRAPRFVFSTGLYDLNYAHVEDFARFAVVMQVQRVCFWDLVEYSYDGTDVRPEHQAKSLRNLGTDALHSCVIGIRRAVRLLEDAHIEVDLTGGFLLVLESRLGDAGGKAA